MHLLFRILLILIFLVTLLVAVLNRSYIVAVVKSPSVNSLIVIAQKKVVSLRDFILMRDLDDFIEILKSEGACVSCDLSNANLKGSNLTNSDLSSANLSGADLSGADLSGSIFTNANLQNANLQNANLENVTIKYANLNYTNFSGANFGENITNNFLTDSNLTYANFSEADFFHAVDLRRKDLTGINLTGADLEDNDLIGANLTGANLSNANLKGATLQNANLTKANLYKANLAGASLINANLTDTNLTFSNLISTDFYGVSFRNMNLTGVNLSRFNFFEKDLTGVILTNAILLGANMDGVNLRNMDLTGVNLRGVNLRNMDLTGVNLSGVDLRNMDLTGVNLSGVDLRNKNLSGTILKDANLTGSKLDGIDFRNMDLTGVNLSDVDLQGIDFSSTILKDVKKIGVNLKTVSNVKWPLSDELIERNVTRYDFSGKSKYISTKDGLLFELVNNKLRLVLDLNKNKNFYFSAYAEGGLLGVAALDNKVFVSFSIRNGEDNNSLSLLVNEYSMNFSKVRNIIKIDGFTGDHFAGGLVLDSKNQLYLAVGDADKANENAQNLNSLKGKILRLDVSESNLNPEIIAYGIRQAWGITIDSQDRIFVSQCGAGTVESVFLLDEYSPITPINFGWPIFEGSQRMKETNPLNINNVQTPIFEYKNRPGCSSAGVYLEDIKTFVHADFYGTIRLLRQNENGEWYSYHEYNQDEMIWSLGLDKETNTIYVAPKNLELEILIQDVQRE